MKDKPHTFNPKPPYMKAIRHFCTEKPEDIIIEKQMLNWHMHKEGVPHSQYREDLLDNKCPYCHRELPMNQLYQNGEIQPFSEGGTNETY